MKLQLMVLSFFSMLSLSILNAQQSSFYLGANGGANTSKFNFTEDFKEQYPNTNSVFGVNGGFDMGILINNWDIRTGVHYIQKGGKYQTDNFDDGAGVGYFTGTEKLHLISIPLTLGYRDYFTNKVGWKLAAGPSFNFGLDGNLDEVTEYFGTDDVDIQNYKVTFGDGVNEDYKNVQVGFQLSPGLFIDLNSRSKLTFNVIWDLGTSDMFNPRYKDANDFFDAVKGNQTQNSTIFTIGYEYHFNFEDRY